MNVVNNRKCILSNIFFIQRMLCGDRSSVTIFRRRTLVVDAINSSPQPRLSEELSSAEPLRVSTTSALIAQTWQSSRNSLDSTSEKKITKHIVIDEIAADRAELWTRDDRLTVVTEYLLTNRSKTHRQRKRRHKSID